MISRGMDGKAVESDVGILRERAGFLTFSNWALNLDLIPNPTSSCNNEKSRR
jgi:hypothetical protein